MQMKLQNSILNTTFMEINFDGVSVKVRLGEKPLRKSRGLSM